MIKAQLLRQRIEARLPHLESDKLTMFVSKGRILTNAKASGAYEQHYTTEIVLTDYAGEPDTLFGTVVDFMREQMPEVMGMSDRILVMCNGRITGNLVSRETTQDEILRYATQFSVQ